MTETIVWAVVWLILTFVGAWLIYAVGAFGGVALAASTERIAFAPLGVAVGAIAAIAWFIFGAVHTVLQIIAIVQLATAS